MRTPAILIFPVAILSGCMTFENLQTTEELKMLDNEGIVVIGAPAGAKVLINSGDLEDGKFSEDGFFPHGIHGTAEKGFLIRKLRVQPQGKAYGLVNVTTDKYYSADCGQNLVTFNVRPGEVQYLTTLTVDQLSNSVRVRWRADLAAASTYIGAKFPDYRGAVTQLDVVVAQQGSCPASRGPIYIPLFIPRSR